MGVKHLYELVPSGLKKRIKEDRRRRWDEQQAKCVATAWTNLSKASKAPESGKKKDAEAKLAQKKMKEEHQTRTELLKDMTAKYEDTGSFTVIAENGSMCKNLTCGIESLLFRICMCVHCMCCVKHLPFLHNTEEELFKAPAL